MTRQYNCNNTEDIYWLSQLCTNGSDTAPYDCVKSYGQLTDLLRKAAGVWFVIVGIVGVLGNLGTLIAIPYAAKLKRHKLDKNFNNTTVFILNLLQQLLFMATLHQ